MHTFPVDYHGSITDAHGRYTARHETKCPRDLDHEIPYWMGIDERLILSDPETGRVVLTCVRTSSVTKIAPDGQPLHIPAVDGDMVRIGTGRGGLVIFAEQEPAYRYGSDRAARVSFYSRSGGRWYISSTVMDLGGGRICREVYSTPEERRMRLLELDREDRITYLGDLRDRPDAWDYEREADALERVAQQIEGLDAAA
ncbi:hypothetical protein [Streptomyces sp. NBC_00239]|uniref:hypothetical protein n=1 Tax=Streptomyces sp. NBC_00239 TaxID=2903640 RepID=UPI002E2AC44C|nr:hypothetical protein [Streptomyces sp. NBC_00239]